MVSWLNIYPHQKTIALLSFCILNTDDYIGHESQSLIKLFLDLTGMTEVAISQFPVTQRIGTLGSAGQLLPGCVARVVKADGSLADYDEEGELHIASPNLALRYTNDEKA